jgi:inositol-phosphate transport system ATP-binding protein
MKGIAVRLEGLTKHFGKVVALKVLDLDIRAGEMVAFLGPSGCGKTTTLLMIAGIYEPTAGAIYFGEHRVDHLHPRDRDIGMVFQSYALYPHLTVFDNVAFPLRLKNTPAAVLRQKVEQTAELLGIAHVLDRRPGQVSGGQQQRAALARALVKEPQILLLDEPLSNLDAQIRLQARGEIRRLQQDLGVTSILVTHDQAEALAMADRIAVFSVGELQQFATPEELYHRPATTFAASFVGHPPMTLLAGNFAASEFIADGLRIPLGRAVPAGPGHLGIRPEDANLRGSIPGRVVLVESLGRQALVTLAVGGAQAKVVVDETSRPALGTEARLGIDPAALHLFDATGRRIEA